MSDRFLILVPNGSHSGRLVALLPILENLLPVKFCVSQEYQPGIAGEIRFGNVAGVAQGSGTSISGLIVPQGEPLSSESERTEIDVRFSDDQAVPFPFRGRSLRTSVAFRPNALTLNPDERPLATCDFGVVWAHFDRDGARHFRSAFVLPTLAVDGSLNDVLNGQRFLEMLPLFHWLREICASASHDGPPLRACFIFDDPNLHWPRYGFVDYRQLAAQAERENYHISFATIPLDTWFTHGGTADVFRQHQTRLSLLVHGNNHTKRELNRSYTEPERILLLEQAIQRIKRLERRTGLSVARVMVPPHGACSEEMLATLPLCGFDAACISHGSLRAHNKSRPWTKTLGYLPFEVIRGCPVLPRWGVSGDLKNTILLAAFLKQAIILRGHHQDLKGGPELLDELARFINGLGAVAWLNMADMARSSYPPPSSVVTSKPFSARKTLALPGASVSFIRRLLTEGRDRLL